MKPSASCLRKLPSGRMRLLLRLDKCFQVQLKGVTKEHRVSRAVGQRRSSRSHRTKDADLAEVRASREKGESGDSP